MGVQQSCYMHDLSLLPKFSEKNLAGYHICYPKDSWHLTLISCQCHPFLTSHIFLSLLSTVVVSIRRTTKKSPLPKEGSNK